MFLSCLGLVLAPWPLRKQLGLFLFVVAMPGSLGRHGYALPRAPEDNEPLDILKKHARDKHSSLFISIGCDKEKSFIHCQRLSMLKTFFPSLTKGRIKLECLPQKASLILAIKAGAYPREGRYITLLKGWPTSLSSKY
jgi:hypothetical protein